MMAKAAANLKRGSRKKQSAQPQHPQQAQPPTAPTQQSKDRQPHPAAPPGSSSASPRNHERPREVVRDNRQPQRQMAVDPRQRQQQLQPQNGTPPDRARRPIPQGREPSPEVVALTNKNYRLAKELSELRVRHRDECKNVTRLTMENMNLASRCREAITHVAMLKKELAMHQKRAKEALALQRQQTQRIASNLSAEVSRLSLSRSFSGESEDATSPNRTKNQSEMERVLASIEPPPPPPPKPTVTPPKAVVVASKAPEKNAPETTPSKLENSTMSDESLANTDVSGEDDESLDSGLQRGGRRSVLDVVESLSDMSSPRDKLSPSEKADAPKVYSTPNKRPKEDRWTPTIDATPGGTDTVADSSSLFPHSASPKLGSSYRQRKYDDEFPPDIVPQQTPTRLRVDLASTISVPDEDEKTDGTESDGSPSGAPSPYLRDEGVIRMNSISAFDASFDNPFPSNFATRESSAGKRPNQSVEIYNPFAPSPTKAHDRREVERLSFGTPPKKEERKSGEFTSHGWNRDIRYSTPSKGNRSPQESPHGEPSRPHKTGSEEARARYAKALQPRNGSTTNQTQSTSTGNSGNTDEGNGSPNQKDGGFLRGSPSRLLQRIQQKRKNKEQPRHESGSNISTEFFPENVEPSAANARDADGFPVTSEKSGAKREREHFHFNDITKPGRKLSEKPFDEPEEEPFDMKPVGPKASRLQEIKSKRTVRQPVSYAEPALNTKIRQGHTYFPKNDEDLATAPIDTALFPI